ncbi:TetR/AcrR family transcriptional regulator [Actinomadura sp. KC216]|uniref:TetR/AcrR family transcriptional regulator n=1 Tax=Actinomadura sp. KC216 TaxID=2530370 RepID=UPI001FB71A6A|nr:TetR/AcrR family transcriptional regulator [Actinomadura sp. KC216]
MPARGDHDARRRDVSEAVWRVLANRGFGGLTLRAVAAEMGASTGLLTHYFPNKKALVTYALDVADERTANRRVSEAKAEGLAALRSALLAVLPLTADSADMNRIWVSSWDGALADPELTVREKNRYHQWRERLRPHVVAAVERGELPLPEPSDVDGVVATVAAFTHGLVVQALFDPERFPPVRQTEILDAFLASLSGR